MTTTFKDFLRQKAEKHQAEVRAGKASVEEWRAAIDRLFHQIRSWLAESDPDGLIEIKEADHNAAEPGLGRYRIPRLDLQAFGKWVGIIPKARNTVATAKPPQKSAPERALGRIDITDEILRYVLYRFPGEGGGDLWLIDDLHSNEPKTLDRAAFEEALMSYFR